MKTLFTAFIILYVCQICICTIYDYAMLKKKLGNFSLYDLLMGDGYWLFFSASLDLPAFQRNAKKNDRNVPICRSLLPMTYNAYAPEIYDCISRKDDIIYIYGVILKFVPFVFIYDTLSFIAIGIILKCKNILTVIFNKMKNIKL